MLVDFQICEYTNYFHQLQIHGIMIPCGNVAKIEFSTFSRGLDGKLYVHSLAFSVMFPYGFTKRYYQKYVSR